MKKKPLLKLIEVMNDLDTCVCEIPCHTMDGIVDYLGECKCCAFCKNYGSHDNCPESHEDDYDTFEWCDYFDDKRDDAKYRLPNGDIALGFYQDILSKADSQTMLERNEATLKKLGFQRTIQSGKTPRYVKENPVFNDLSIRMVILLNDTAFKPEGENSADIWFGREYIGQEGGSSLTTKADEPIENLLKSVNDVVTKNLCKLQSEFSSALDLEDVK